ncbi:hypothetical protein RRF57_007054 [Xylaria bambusicola]|uniref:N-acetyltransferase domain-containing protein n=1 Tax=Xylaria bambusicola TaxID=326684 RepID=A0AAN7YZG6_9PEZI
MIAKSHWRKGYGLKTFYTFTEYAFITLDIMRVRIETDLANEPWRRLMHAVGLTEFEEQKRVTYGEKSMGYSWLVDAATWQVIREDMQKRGKWPL